MSDRLCEQVPPVRLEEHASVVGELAWRDLEGVGGLERTDLH
jgi:hypothetical protein